MKSKCIFFSMLTLTLFAIFVAKGSTTTTIPVVNTVNLPIDLGNSGNKGPGVCVNNTEITSGGIPLPPRSGNYTFTGETIEWEVVVRDENSIQEILDLEVLVDGNVELICNEITEILTCRVFGVFNATTDKVYRCLLTTESLWSGMKEVIIRAKDKQGGSSEYGLEYNETWNFNPELSYSVDVAGSGNLTFEDWTPGNTSYSINNLTINNTGSVNSPSLIIFLAGMDFYASTGWALCPTSNVLVIENMDYYAWNSTFNTGWKTMPEFDSNGGCAATRCKSLINNRILTNSFELKSNEQIRVKFRINYPTPCFGNFETGEIKIMAKPI